MGLSNWGSLSKVSTATPIKVLVTQLQRSGLHWTARTMGGSTPDCFIGDWWLNSALNLACSGGHGWGHQWVVFYPKAPSLKVRPMRKTSQLPVKLAHLGCYPHSDKVG